MFLLVATSNSTTKTLQKEADSLESAEEARTNIKRRAKSKAKEAITSILLPHCNNSNLDTKIDQLNNSKQENKPQTIKQQVIDNTTISSTSKRGRSRSSKRRRSQSSTIESSSSISITNKQIKDNSKSDKSTTSHYLRSSKNISLSEENKTDLPSTSKKLSRKISLIKSVPKSKKAKLNSDQNNCKQAPLQNQIKFINLLFFSYKIEVAFIVKFELKIFKLFIRLFFK